jgi:hypothetical protein
VIIGFIGHKGSGKDTAANALVGYTNLKMAGALKDMLRALYLAADIDPEPRIEGHLKEQHCPLLNSTPRYAMQTLGTEWARMIDPDLWLRIWKHQASAAGGNVVCTDIRFKREAKLLRSMGGMLIHIHRPGLEVDMSHASEQEVTKIRADMVITNDGSVEQLHERVRRVC